MLLNGGCNHQAPDTEQPVAAIKIPGQPAPAPHSIQEPPPDSTDVSVRRLYTAEAVDTLIYLADKPYRLTVAVEADSARRLTYDPPTDDTLIAGVDARCIFRLVDAQRREVFRREIRKAALEHLGDKEAVVTGFPTVYYAGFSAARQEFLFQLSLIVPDTDVGSDYVVRLSRNGNVLGLAYAFPQGGDTPDCAVQFSPDGRAILTCEQLLAPGKSAPVLLKKPTASLVAAHFLSDSTLFTLYEYGTLQVQKDPDGLKELTRVVPARLRNQPNAFVLNLKGEKLAQFPYKGFYEELSYVVPRCYVWQNQTYYLLDETRGLRLLNKRIPGKTQEVKFKAMTTFKAPQRPQEVRFRISTSAAEFEFYADKAQPEKLRYRRVATAG